MTLEPITTAELLDAGEQRTGLLRAQLIRMVGKSAAVRHVAAHPVYGPKFVLKGGSLLTHVYGSPRQSIADADYVHLEPDLVKAPDLDDAFSFSEGDFTMAALFRPIVEHRTDDVGGFSGDVTFDIEGISLSLDPRRGRGDRRMHDLKITVSVRRGERLDLPDGDLTYRDQLLTSPDNFRVEGLTRNELAAEKVLAWCSKDLAKHFVDLAYLKREHEAYLDFERIGSLVRQKFQHERGDRRYALRGITSVGKLAAAFANEARIEQLVRRDWQRLAADEIFFLPHEQSHGKDERLIEAANVERLALAFWSELDPHLRDNPPARRRR